MSTFKIVSKSDFMIEDIKEKLTLQKLDEDATLYYQTLIDIRKENNIKEQAVDFTGLQIRKINEKI